MELTLVQRIGQDGWAILHCWPKTQRKVDSPLYGAQGDLYANRIRNKIIAEGPVEGLQELEYLCVKKEDVVNDTKRKLESKIQI